MIQAVITRTLPVQPALSGVVDLEMLCCAAKPVICRRTSASEPFSSMLRSAIISSVIPDQGPGRVLSVGDCCGDQTLPKEHDDRSPCQRSYTTTGDVISVPIFDNEPLSLAIEARMTQASSLADQDAAFECVSVLREIRRHIDATALDRSWFRTVVVKLIGTASRLWGSGASAESREIFEGLIDVAYDESGPISEYLLINLYVKPDMTTAERLVGQAVRMGFSEPTILLLITEYYCRAKNYEKAVEYYALIRNHRFGFGSYDIWLAIIPNHIKAMLLDKLKHAVNLLALPELARAYGPLLTVHLLPVRDPQAFYMRVARLSFYNDLNINGAFLAVAEALDQIVPELDVERRVAAFAFYVATQDLVRVEHFLATWDGDGELWSHPLFLRWTCLYARSRNNAILERRALAEASRLENRDGIWRLPTAKVAALELQAQAGGKTGRRVAPKRVSLFFRKPAVFIGIFGQLRHEDIVLPQLQATIARLEQQLKQSLGARVYCALSLWDKTGQRPIIAESGNHGGINVLYSRLPAPLVGALRLHGIHQIEHVAAHLPRMLDLAVRASQETLDIDEALIRRHFKRDFLLDVRELRSFKTEEDDLVAASGTHQPRAPDWRNQLRMWERVGAFKPIIERIEKAHGGPIIGGAFVRSDLIINCQSLDEVMKPFLSGAEDGRIAGDYDPCAFYFEGIGDRYFLGDRTGLLSIAGCWDHLKVRIAETVNGTRDSTHRFVSHAFIASKLFEDGIQMHHMPREKLAFEVCRGHLPWQIIRDALRKDIDDMHAGPLKGALEALLATHPDSAPA